MNVLLVYPEFPDTFWSFKHALRFIGRKASSPPLGLLTVASMLPANWSKRLVDMNVERLTDEDIARADIVMISAMVVQRSSAKEVIKRSRRAGKRIVAGGPLFSAEWFRFSEIDHLVLGEGEVTLPQFLEDFEKGNPAPLYQASSYADLSATPIPAWGLAKISAYESLSIQYSRGCPYNCEFCNVTALFGHRPRTKSAEQIVAELNTMYYDLGWRRNIFFVDDNFIGNRRQIKDEILPALITWRKGKIGCPFITEASINLADDPELISMMREAGFVSVFIGIETPLEESLRECHKSHNMHRDLLSSVRRLQQAGLQVMGGFIVGFDNDPPTVFKQQVEFIQRSGIVTAMVGMLQAPYGTPLYERLAAEGRLQAEISGDNTDGTTNILPRMGLNQLREGYQYILRELYSPHGFYRRIMTFLDHYVPPRIGVPIKGGEIKAFIKAIWELGIKGDERREFWHLLFRTLIKYPKKFVHAITLAIYGFHFRKVMQTNEIPSTLRIP